MNAHVLHVMSWTRSSLRAGLSTHTEVLTQPTFAAVSIQGPEKAAVMEGERLNSGNRTVHGEQNSLFSGDTSEPQLLSLEEGAHVWKHIHGPGELTARYTAGHDGRKVHKLLVLFLTGNPGMGTWGLKASGLRLTWSPRALSLVASLLPHFLGRKFTPSYLYN